MDSSLASRRSRTWLAAVVLACCGLALLVSFRLGLGLPSSLLLAGGDALGREAAPALGGSGGAPAPAVEDVSAGAARELPKCGAQVRRARTVSCTPFSAEDPQPRVLVTGGAGFIGSTLVKRLRAQGIQSVKVVDNLWRGRVSNLCDYDCSCAIDMSADFCFADLTDPVAAGGLFKNVDVVYHLADVIAGIGFVFQNEHFLYQHNVQINTDVLQAVLREGTVKDYIYVGSACSFPLELQSSYEPVALHEDQTYPAHPESAYGWSKLMGEYEASLVLKMDRARRRGLNVGLLRFHNVYGPYAQYADKAGSQALPALIRKAINYPQAEQFEVWGSSRQYRDFVYVDDIVESLIAVRKRGMNKGVIQIGTGVATTLLHAAGVIQNLTRKCLGKELVMKANTSQMEGDMGRVAVLDRAKEILGWEAKVYVEEGLPRLYAWILEDMAQRGRAEPWMVADGGTFESAIACLSEEAAGAQRRPIARSAATRLPDGLRVWAAAPPSFLQPFGGRPSCGQNGGVAPQQAAATRALVVVVGASAGHRVTWPPFHAHLLAPLGVDLALLLPGAAAAAEMAGSGFRAAARFVWEVAAPPKDDYRHYYAEVATACFGSDFSWEDAKSIAGDAQGAAVIFLRWLVLQYLLRDGLLANYSHVILTQPDYLHVHPHPPISTFAAGSIGVQAGEGARDSVERHTVLHAADAPRVLRLLEHVVLGARKEVAEKLGLAETHNATLGIVLDAWYRSLSLEVRPFDPCAFSVDFPVHDKHEDSGPGDGGLDPYVPIQVHPRDRAEYSRVVAGRRPHAPGLYGEAGGP